jgi:hypothetical protein
MYVEREPGVDDVLDMAELRTEEADQEMLGWDNSVEVAGTDLTSLGFVKLVKGFAFRGFVNTEDVVDSNYDSEAGKRKQRVYKCFGTVRAPIQGAEGGFGEVRGKVTIPMWTGLAESIEENRKLEAQGADTFDADTGQKKRSGRHIFRVVRIATAPKAAAPA